MNISSSKEYDISPSAKALKRYIQDAAQLLHRRGAEGKEDDAALIYLGNPHISIPQQLLTAPDLDSDEKILWALLRESFHKQGHPVLSPDQQTLAHQIGRVRQTVAEKLRVLRLRRWITLCAQTRSNQGGRYLLPIYAIHDEPMVIADTIYLDSGYIAWTKEQSINASGRVSNIAREVLVHIDVQIDSTDDITSSPGLLKRTISKLVDPTVDLERKPHVKNSNMRILRATNSSSSSSCTATTTTETREIEELRFPKSFSPKEIEMARSLLGKLSTDERQYALDYVQDRLHDKNQIPIGNNIRYLNKIINLICDGELNPSSYGLTESKNETGRDVLEQAESPEESQRRWEADMKRRGIDIGKYVKCDA